MTTNSTKFRNRWEWQEGAVDSAKDHFELRFGSPDDLNQDAWVMIALVGSPNGRIFPVKFAVNPTDQKYSRGVAAVRRELDFYLVEKNERNAFGYAYYHCGTAANLYSAVHWSFHQGTVS